MPETLTAEELTALIERVFRLRSQDQALALLVDLPDAHVADEPDWKDRRQLAGQWAALLRETRPRHGLDVDLILYRNVRSNNAELPQEGWLHKGGRLPDSAEQLDPALQQPLEKFFPSYQILIAPTQFSTTAPLKKAAPRFGFRAATMPRFSRKMIPALRLDYGEVNRRVEMLARLLDRSLQASIHFQPEGGDAQFLLLDLRHRKGHASGGLVPQPGTAFNLPSGEAFIVPYEGEFAGDESRSNGILPVQFGDEVVLYRIERNRAVSVESPGAASYREAELLVSEPAYGNLAELGLGVLAGMGIEPIGETLLDEKLGLHIAFGRSDHFGGRVGPSDFGSPQTVVHIDRIYLPQIQSRVKVVSAELKTDSGESVQIVRDDLFVFDFGSDFGVSRQDAKNAK